MSATTVTGNMSATMAPATMAPTAVAATATVSRQGTCRHRRRAE